MHSQVNMTGIWHSSFAACLLLTLMLSLHAGEISFDFSRTSGDRQHAFGTHLPLDRFDYNFNPASFQVQGGILKATSKQTSMIILDDQEPDLLNDPASTNGKGLTAVNLTIRTRFDNLSSGDAGVAGSTGILLGITRSDGYQGFMAAVDRVPGSNMGQLHIDIIKDGNIETNLITSSSFVFGSTSAIYFLEVQVSGQQCRLKLFADAAIPGAGAVLPRLSDPAFDSVTPVSEITCDLPDYIGGLTGLYFEDTGQGGNDGGVSFHNFYYHNDGANIDPENPPQVQYLTHLTSPTEWQVTAGSSVLQVDHTEGYLHLDFDASTSNSAQLDLTTPVTIPDWATNLTFTSLADNHSAQIRLDARIQDSQGNEYLYKSKVPYNNEYYGDIDIFNAGVQANRTYRFSFPGLLDPDLDTTNGTIIPLTVSTLPVKPLFLKGLTLDGVSQTTSVSSTNLYFRDFAFTHVNGSISSLYYNFRDLEFFGELEPVPHITLADLWNWTGTAEAVVFWDIRDGYDKLPFITGHETISMPQYNATIPPPIQFGHRLEFPITDPGTYWVRVRIRRTDILRRFSWYDRFEELEYRLYIVQGTESLDQRQSLSGAVPRSKAKITIGGSRTSLIIGEQETFSIPVTFFQPEDAQPDETYHLQVRVPATKEILAESTVTPVWDSNGTYTETVNLTGYSGDAFVIEARIDETDDVYEKIVRTVGRESAIQTPGPVPADIVSYATHRSLATDPMFHLSPMIHSTASQYEEFSRWNFFKPFLDQASTVSSDLEYAIPWSLIEPLPGVYDWSEIDTFLDYAQTKGLKVLLWPSFRDAPEWLPSHFTKSEDGRIFFDFAYHFHGGRLNYWHSDAIRQPALAMFDAMVRRYHDHPALQGYKFLMELPGDVPWMEWFEGYSDETLQHFRDTAAQNWGSVSNINTRWQTAFPTMDAIMPPGEANSHRFWSDWMMFRAEAVNQLIYDYISTVRAVDTIRPIFVYNDGVGLDLDFLVTQGCFTANGGVHDATRPQDAVQIPLMGLQERAEDHSPGKWQGYFPTQLDGSFFAMMLGGGANAHIKHYMFTYLPGLNNPGDELPFSTLRQPPYGLDRYEAFQEIARELRKCQPPVVDAFLYRDIQAFLTETGQLSLNGFSDGWSSLLGYQNHFAVGAGPHSLWSQAPLLLVTKPNTDILEQSAINEITNYVQNGGTLLMRADAGRTVIDSSDDWVLLQAFGLVPPTTEPAWNLVKTAVPNAGSIFSTGAGSFALRDIITSPAQSNIALEAVYDGNTATPAMISKTYGSGKVIVIWAHTIIPPQFNTANYRFLRDVVSWAGGTLTTDCTSDRFWLNALTTSDPDLNYGLVNYGQGISGLATAQTSAVTRWLFLPDGTYNVHELISNTIVGQFTGQSLRETGITTTLNPREVVIYRFSRIAL